MASFTYNAAMRDGMLPRKPMPKEPPKDAKAEAPKPATTPSAPAVTPHK
jgi:hypothetical protein